MGEASMCAHTHTHTSSRAGTAGSLFIFLGWWEPDLLRKQAVMSAQPQSIWKLMKSVLYCKKGEGSWISDLRWETEGDRAESGSEGRSLRRCCQMMAPVSWVSGKSGKECKWKQPAWWTTLTNTEREKKSPFGVKGQSNIQITISVFSIEAGDCCLHASARKNILLIWEEMALQHRTPRWSGQGYSTAPCLQIQTSRGIWNCFHHGKLIWGTTFHVNLICSSLPCKTYSCLRHPCRPEVNCFPAESGISCLYFILFNNWSSHTYEVPAARAGLRSRAHRDAPVHKPLFIPF